MLLMLAIGGLVSLWVFNQVKATGLFSRTSGSEDATEIANRFDVHGSRSFNTMFLALALGLFIGAIILAFNLRSSPLFYPLAMIILLVGLILAVVLSNVYQGFSSAETFDETRQELFFMDNVMQHLPLYFLGFGILMLAVLYGLGRAISSV